MLIVENNQNIQIIGVDPGAMCGVAVFQWIGSHRYFQSYEKTPLETIRFVRKKIDDMSGWVVASQRYTISSSGRPVSQQLDAIETNGALRFIVLDSVRLHHEFMLLPQAEAKKIGTTKVLKALGWWQTTKDGHANDAARQVLLALLMKQPTWYEHLLSGIQST
jgi:hypothetical protein